MTLPQFESKKDLFRFLKENKSTIIAQKKYAVKQADPVFNSAMTVPVVKNSASKAEAMDISEATEIKAELIINTTGIMDSHSDVHIPGLWKKSLSERKELYLLQEHKMKFDKIITDEVEASIKKMLWSDIGQPFEGGTEALMFAVKILKSRNPYMFDQYSKGYVKNHSVGMRYFKLFMCVNSDEKYYIDERDHWEKYFPYVANKDDAEEQGYFWAVTEGGVVEGSAVPIGSNTATPVYSISEKSQEPDKSTPEADKRAGEIATQRRLIQHLF